MVREEREVWAYPTIAFIADLGDISSILVGAYIRTFPCMEATYPYAIKNQRKARNAHSRGLWVP